MDYTPIVGNGGTLPEENSNRKRADVNGNAVYSDKDYIIVGKNWRILSVDDNNNMVTITTNEPTKGLVYLASWAPRSDFLNELCKYYYGKEGVAPSSSVRSMDNEHSDKLNYNLANLTTKGRAFWLASEYGPNWPSNGTQYQYYVTKMSNWGERAKLHWRPSNGDYDFSAAFSLRPVVSIPKSNFTFDEERQCFVVN